VTQRRKRWSGKCIVVWDDNTWEFFRCCRCGELLEDDASRKRGLSPGCKDKAAWDEVWGVMNARAREDAYLAQTEPTSPMMRRTTRAEALAVICPRCKAKADEPCRGSRGQPRVSCHAERHARALELGAPPVR
jgi:hypothetical protein